MAWEFTRVANWAFFYRESCTIFQPQIPKPQISKCTSTYSDRNRFESQRMPGWWAWEQRRHNGGVRCPHSQDDQEAHFQSAIESAALFWSVKSPACMNWRDLQSLACRHFCSGAEPWLSVKYISPYIVIDITSASNACYLPAALCGNVPDKGSRRYPCASLTARR